MLAGQIDLDVSCGDLDEFVGSEGHGATSHVNVEAVIPGAKGDAALVERQAPAVRDGARWI
jgi:hypothetical protein